MHAFRVLAARLLGTLPSRTAPSFPCWPCRYGGKDACPHAKRLEYLRNLKKDQVGVTHGCGFGQKTAGHGSTFGSCISEGHAMPGSSSPPANMLPCGHSPVQIILAALFDLLLIHKDRNAKNSG